MDQSHIVALFSAFREANPHPRGELNSETPFQHLVAVVLSAQSTDVGVNRVTPGLFRTAPTPEAMVALGEEGIAGHIRSLGLYHSKARYIHALSRILLERHQGEVPDDRASLESLPGVGRKTANVVLNVCFGHPTLAVDTHVFRLARRLGLARGETPEAVERELVEIIPPEFMRHAHHWLILHGRYVCTARKPKCPSCMLTPWCPRLGVEGEGVHGG
ncbi:MAG: endonuclease III [Magnetococcales bacterium]|nr:endonuclease III [Magnetococcales bacterium]MBF0151290.1 endonuclease III [Magnetococcales bacterium]MBF0172041.1 endonuclease III [Magnetococcales bacterium]